MRGDEDEVQKDAVFESVYRATLNKKFLLDVAAIRRRNSIPQRGYSKPLGLIDYVTIHLKIHDDLQELMRRYKLLPTTEILIEDFVATNKVNYQTRPNHFACEYETFYPPYPLATTLDYSKEAKWKGTGQPFIRIYIPRETSLKNAQAFLKAHWRFFNKLVFNKAPGQKSIRISRHSKRDGIILSYASKSRKELGLKKGEYKNIRIASILNEQHGYRKITSEIVQSVISRRKC